MRYTIYKLSFPNGIHIGTGNLSSTEKVIHSDTLFSAMCIEALNMGGEEELNRFVQMAKDNQLRISDAMPYIGDTMYLPKPMIRIEGTDKDSALKKEFKKVVWPTKEAVFKNSLVVLSVVILGSAVVGLLDTGFLKLMKFLMELSK